MGVRKTVIPKVTIAASVLQDWEVKKGPISGLFDQILDPFYIRRKFTIELST